MRRWLSILLITWACFPAWAALDLELTQGVDGRLPIVVLPFEAAGRVSGVVQADLAHSGRFSVLPLHEVGEIPHKAKDLDPVAWRNRGADYVLIGSVRTLGKQRYQVHFALLDLYGEHRVVVEGDSTVSEKGLRCFSHHISDTVYQHLLQMPGVFSTRIAYVLLRPFPKRKGATEYRLEVADADGFHPETLLISDQPIMSPAWLSNGKSIAYVSFEGHRAAVYVQDIATGNRRKVAAYPGINGAPAWSPDGQKLALVLSKGGAPNLYVLSLKTGALQQLTLGQAIDTEPNWSPDGHALFFTSDRGGSPQLYRIDLATRAVERITFVGPYNARASLAADGRTLALLHREDHGFSIAVLDRETGVMRVLTDEGINDSPSIAPNGSMVLFTTQYQNRSILSIVSTDGNVHLRYPARSGDVQDPAWSGALRCRSL